MMVIKRNLKYGIFLVVSLLLVACSSQHVGDFHRLSDTFAQADQAYRKGETAAAMEGFKQCINECADARYERDDSVKLLLPKAMVQLLNTYQVQGDVEGCVNYFDSLRQVVDAKPQAENQVLCRDFKRDVYVLLAYAMSRTDAEEAAAQLMTQALKMPLSYPTPERRFRDDAYATGVYFCVPAYQKQVMAYGRKALDEVRHCHNKSGAQWLVTALGSMYHRQGKVDKAIGMYQEGYDLAVMDGDTLGMANAKKIMADYLLQWQLDSISDRYATEAVDLLGHVAQPNPMVATGIYLTKARILKDQHQKQAALSYLTKAKTCCSGLPYNSGSSDVALLMGSLLVDKSKPHYVGDDQQGIALLTGAAHQATYQIKAAAFFELAKAYIDRGNRQAGEASLDSMWQVLHSVPSPLVLDGAYDYALRYYQHTGNQSKAALYSKALQQLNSIAEPTVTTKKVIEVITHMEAEQKAADMASQAEAMSKEKRQVIIFWILFTSVCAATVGAYCYHKRKQTLRVHAQAHQKLSLAEEQLQRERAQKERVLQELEQAKVKRTHEMRNTDNLLAALRKEGAVKFLDDFAQAYPHFQERLREKIEGKITDKDAVYCCLIALGLDNAKITKALQVERSTVVMAKYRLRKKLDLDESATLEKYLMGLLNMLNPI